MTLQYFPRRTIGETRTQLLCTFNTRIDGVFCNELIIDSEKYLNKQISEDPECSKYGRIGYFVNPRSTNPSDEVMDFDDIDLVGDDVMMMMILLMMMMLKIVTGN